MRSVNTLSVGLQFQSPDGTLESSSGILTIKVFETGLGCVFSSQVSLGPLYHYYYNNHEKLLPYDS